MYDIIYYSMPGVVQEPCCTPLWISKVYQKWYVLSVSSSNWKKNVSNTQTNYQNMRTETLWSKNIPVQMSLCCLPPSLPKFAGCCGWYHQVQQVSPTSWCWFLKQCFIISPTNKKWYPLYLAVENIQPKSAFVFLYIFLSFLGQR